MNIHKIKFDTDYLGDERNYKLQLIRELQKDQFCPFCIIRFINWQNIGLCSMGIETIKDVLNEIVDQNSYTFSYTENFCKACSNILPYISEDIFRKQVLNHIQNSGFHYYSYLHTVTVPVYFQLSDALIFNQLKQKNIIKIFGQIKNQNKYGSHNENQITSTNINDYSIKEQLNLIMPIKKLAKFILGPYLTPLLQVPVSFQSPFHCDVELLIDKQLNLSQSFLDNIDKTVRRQMNKNLKQENTTEVIGNEINKLIYSAKDLNDLSQYINNLDQKPQITNKLEVSREVIFIAARYLKLQRGIAQTGDSKMHHDDNEQKQSENSDDNEDCVQLDYSIEQILEPIFIKYCEFDRFILTAAGREDIDVRMMGDGRPVIFQLYNSKNCCLVNWDDVCSKINEELLTNNYIQLNSKTSLQLFEKGDNSLMMQLYQGSTEKIKNYRALVYSENLLNFEQLQQQLSQIKDQQILQKTPVRVLHRRPLIERKKFIYKVELQKIINEHYFVINVKSSAGCYIKEFVHGDFNRTKPNLSTICDLKLQIIQLDVLNVECEWPPQQQIVKK